ncbi:uncharacterized protein LOC105434777 isoform X1 [Cucumis sativus]|uniref:uncharacterized protein LOC105434777 isoform X1 n=1 Tax=Cucumis sativus TaxID=3659 RepID=UPI0005EC7F72|nr:uncharacterized protein LOC105434777 isoform X1 [Cucumis sativus]
MATVSKENKVLVTVYSEKQEPRLPVNRYQRDNVNKVVRNQWKQDTANKGYNRRTELLKYSQRLRKSARSPASPYIRTPEPIPLKNKQPIARSIAINLVCTSFSLVNLCGKPKGPRFTSCFGNLIQRSYKALTSFQPKKDRQKQNQSSGSTKKVNEVKNSESKSKNTMDKVKGSRIRLLTFTCT